jgi:lysophospholipase L1-like esterase
MKINHCLFLLAASVFLAGCSGMRSKMENASEPQERPTLFLIGDSTVNNSTKGQVGWGTVLPELFDTNRIRIVNRARGGRSSRTYFTEGLWSQVQSELKPGDFVLMQFGHNDGGPLTHPKNRASVKGIGDETRSVTNQTTGVVEDVHSYGWYLRQYVSGAKAKGATPIVLSLVPRNMWANGKVLRASKDYGKWAGEVAKAEGVPFIDLNEIVARHYEELGQDKVAADLFGATDHTHTTPAGAKLNAECVVEGIRDLKLPLVKYLEPKRKN